MGIAEDFTRWILRRRLSKVPNVCHVYYDRAADAITVFYDAGSPPGPIKGEVYRREFMTRTNPFLGLALMDVSLFMKACEAVDAKEDYYCGW